MNELERRKGELAAQDALRSRLSTLQDDVASLRLQIDAADLDTLAGMCDSAWRQIKSANIVLHELLVHEHPNPDPLAPTPTERIQACVEGALTQIEGVMGDEYEIDIIRKRLHMALALAHHALEGLDEQMDALEESGRQYPSAGGP